ncbi:hypothetical protein AMAG_18466 [Allomyces macrogynus ATCC 38327]|uniref:Uncharacterized protein n=1 Tax=Allomyces macrogynus (strain ATCC 38327) TaxID=578462 RepID=A0A0L0SBZ3_ALLM3|nr:hypothetical protein AMAG_18466 [Allomyces macrogynus ATCC 38327]|eukprot:KNE60068.1 hypothetical protein AMAG_18466 [Allomyces macrogynus ATCC 38327]
MGKYARIFWFLLSLLSLQWSTQSIFVDSREAQRLALPVGTDPTTRNWAGSGSKLTTSSPRSGVFVDTLTAALTAAVDAARRAPAEWRDQVLGGDTAELPTDTAHPIVQPTGTLTSRPLQDTLYVQARSVGAAERVARAYLHARHNLAHGARVASGALTDLAARLTTAADEYRDATRLLVRILMAVEERTAGNGAYAVVRRRSIAGAAAAAAGEVPQGP